MRHFYNTWNRVGLVNGSIKKKTAVILYGYMRTFKDTAPHLIKNILMVNNADLFIFAMKMKAHRISLIWKM